MGLLDDHNSLHGSFSERRAEGKDRPMVWALAAVGFSVLWLFGFGSVLGISAGVYVLTGEAPLRARRLGLVGIALGCVGLCLAFAMAIQMINR